MSDDLFYTKNFLANKGYEVGDYTYGHPTVYDWNEGTTLKIGRFTSIAEGVTIMLGGNHRTEWVTTYPFPAINDKWPEAQGIGGHPVSKGDVVIGNDVWLGYGATILSGVKIGDGAVIAAKALITKDVPPYSIAGGCPAKVIKYRFSPTTIERLLSLKWWDWKEKRIKKYIKILCSNNIEEIFNV